ncbi:MAG: hypothetical protein ACYCOU_04535 [Sulfobacillus sp.]
MPPSQKVRISLSRQSFLVEDPANSVLPILRAVFAHLRQGPGWTVPRAVIGDDPHRAALVFSDHCAAIFLYLMQVADDPSTFERLLRELAVGGEVTLDEIIEACARRGSPQRYIGLDALDEVDLWTLWRITETIEDACIDYGYFDHEDEEES